MNKDLLETQWIEAKEFLRERWNRLTDDDIRQINGNIDQLLTKLQNRYGISREQAEEEIRRWNISKPTSQRASYESVRPAREERTTYQRDERGNLAKWLLWLGVPLLLLLGYLSNPGHDFGTAPSDTAVQSTSPTQDMVINAQTPADYTLAQSIRQALAGNGITFRDFRNIRISANNGAVTVSGSVATPEQRDRVTDVLNNIPGVNKVNNQIEVRPQ